MLDYYSSMMKLLLVLQEMLINNYYSLEKAAKNGVFSANFYLGEIELAGSIGHPNSEKAIDFFIRGAAKNDPYCFLVLSKIYAEGILVEKDTRL